MGSIKLTLSRYTHFSGQTQMQIVTPLIHESVRMLTVSIHAMEHLENATSAQITSSVLAKDTQFVTVVKYSQTIEANANEQMKIIEDAQLMKQSDELLS